MHTLKKLYCRCFQISFRAALPLMPYREPKLIDGFSGVPKVLQKHSITRLLLVTDPGVYSLGLTTPLEQILKKAGITCIVYKDTVANPTSANVEDAKNLYLKKHCQALLAFGGGSSMDCAKGVGARLARPNKSLAKMEGILHVMHKLPLLIAVPTTAGTGSETTLAAVITDADTHHKYAINDFSLIPHYAVLEPEVTVGLPAQLTATTGMDALTHAIEAYIGRSTTKQTRKAAIEAIQLIFQYLPVAYKNGKNRTARKEMLRASYLAGTAFTKSYVGYVHAVAHSLGVSTASRMDWQTPFFFRSFSKRTEAPRTKNWLTSPDHQTFFFPGRYHRSQCFYRTYPKNERFHEHPDDPRRYP